jgi:hypothetical protein
MFACIRGKATLEMKLTLEICCSLNEGTVEFFVFLIPGGFE